MEQPQAEFGGEWTRIKLEVVRRYLAAYQTALKNQRFHTAYIDAFAGTGYYLPRQDAKQVATLLPQLIESEAVQLRDGSVRNALKVDPPFQKYIFIEYDERKAAALESLKTEFPDRAGNITIVTQNANTYLQQLCSQADWRRYRAVLFLDPFGMQVSWETLMAIAKTEAMDMWLLFPLGVAVNRMLTRDGEIPPAWQARLDQLFGTHDWHQAFYRESLQQSFFDETPRMEKVATLDAIGNYFVERLRTIFPAVARPRSLYNSTNNPLYLLCFAVGNPKPTAIGAALGIANHILKMEL